MVILLGNVASFPGLPTIQFLVTYSMQEWTEEAGSILPCEWCQCLPR